MRTDVDRPSYAVRAHRILGCLAIAHAAVALSAILFAFRFAVPEWFDRVWVALVITWLFWPFVSIFHHGRSDVRVGVPLVLSFLLLAPCAPWFAKVSPRVFAGTDRAPTLDRPNLVESESLGGGFRRVRLEEFITGGFESIYHGEYLYFGKRKLNYFVSSSLSPSRAFAAYADSDLQSEVRGNQDGFHVFIFRASDQQIFRVTTDPLSYQGKFEWEWDEAAGHLSLRFRDGRPPKEFLLPAAR